MRTTRPASWWRARSPPSSRSRTACRDYEARLPVVFDEMVSNGRFDVSQFVRVDLDRAGEDLRPLSEEGHARDRLGCRHRDLGPEEERHVQRQDGEGPRRLHAVEGPHREGLAHHRAAARRGAGRERASCAPSRAADNSWRARPARPPSRSAAPRWSSIRSGISARSCRQRHETRVHRRVALASAALSRAGAGDAGRDDRGHQPIRTRRSSMR